MSKVSIVLPTYNGSRYLRESIDSCLNQTYSDIELIVVDDASTGDTLDIINSYPVPRLKVIRHEQNRGLPTALNTGFALASGDYLTWTSDDNRYAPEAIQRLVTFLESHPEIDLVYTDHVYINDADNEVGWFRTQPPAMIREFNVVGACFMYRRRVYEALGKYDLNALWAEDYEYWLRAYRRFNLHYWPIEYPMYYLRVHDASLTARHKWDAHALAAKLRRKILGLSWLEYNRQMSYVHVQAAFEAYNLGNKAEVWRRFFLAIARNPAWLCNRGFLAIVAKSLRIYKPSPTRSNRT